MIFWVLNLNHPKKPSKHGSQCCWTPKHGPKSHIWVPNSPKVRHVHPTSKSLSSETDVVFIFVRSTEINWDQPINPDLQVTHLTLFIGLFEGKILTGNHGFLPLNMGVPGFPVNCPRKPTQWSLQTGPCPNGWKSWYTSAQRCRWTAHPPRPQMS